MNSLFMLFYFRKFILASILIAIIFPFQYFSFLNPNFAIGSNRGDTFLKGVTSKLKVCNKF